MSIQNICFNQKASLMSVCTNNGYLIYNLSSKIEKIMQAEKHGGVGIMKMLHMTNISVLVGGGDNPFSPKSVAILWDDAKKKSVIDINVHEPVKNVLINRDKIVLVLQNKLCIFNYAGILLETKETYCNERGLCTMSLNDDVPIILTLGTKKGSVGIWNLNKDTFTEIDAHQSKIVALAITVDGSMIATASETGTVIKVYSSETGSLLYEFRRGTTSTQIYSLAFSQNNNFVACTSANGTAHIFELYRDVEKTKNTMSTFSGFKDYLPSYFGSQWGMKQVRLDSTVKSVCAFDETGNLHIATFDGTYYRVEHPEFSKVTKNKLIVVL